MRRKPTRISYVVASALLFAGVCAADSLSTPKAIAKSDVHHGCVSWKTRERFGFVWTRDAVGVNCKITSILQQVAPGQFRFEMLVPIEGFQSGSKARDREVLRILKAQVQPNLFFVTDARPLREWKAFLKNGETDVHGSLSIAGGSYPVRTKIHIVSSTDGPAVEGVVHTRFKDLGLEPPVVFGGAFTKVSPDLDLSFHIPTRETLNFQRLAGAKK